MLPKDPCILLCIINTKLRDFYSSLDALCDDLDESINSIKEILSTINYYYDEDINQFIQK